VKRTLLAFAAAVAVGANANALAAAAPSATPTPDACAAKKSQWERTQCEDFANSAPGDEYFGRMKMSFLGINNTYHDEAIRAGDYTTNTGIINKVAFADEALEQWSSRYPRDPQLARSYFLAIQVHKKIYTQASQQLAWNYMQLLVTRFPTTYFGKLEKADIARGFTEHWFADPVACPTPVPSGVVVLGTPAVLSTPTPADTPTPKPGQPRVEILTPPCVAPSP
jgi:hypothetical protein